MRTVLEVYYVVNAFFVGLLWATIKNDNASIYRKILALFIMFSTGVLLYVVQYVVDFLKWIKSTFELGFFYKFYFTKRFDNVDDDYLEFATDLMNRKKYVKRFMVSLAIKAIKKRIQSKTIKP